VAPHGDLQYNIAHLDSLSSLLSRLVGELRRDNAGHRYDVGDLAHQVVVDAFNDFSTNWSSKLERLTTNLDALAQMTTSASQEFQRADNDLRVGR
jgi:hypothetical protein